MPENLNASAPTSVTLPAPRMPRLPVLDGWRGISILAVLAAHMLPLGPARFDLNYMAGEFGMGLFFALSGFLITSTLYFHPSVRDFVIRRLFRIVPAAWLFLLITLAFTHADLVTWRANLLFYANLPPYHLTAITGHFWSLCVEVQFYALIAVLFLLFRKAALALLPFVCVAVTLNRIHAHVTADIYTLYRLDDILAGAALAYLFHSRFSAPLKRLLAHIPPAIPLVLLFLGGHKTNFWISQFRPYCAVIAIGATLYHHGTLWNRVLESRPLKYLATISYALYIWHPLTTHGWFEPASKVAKYARRPLGIALSFLLAHLSTHYWEQPFIHLGKRLTRRKSAVPAAQPQVLTSA